MGDNKQTLGRNCEIEQCYVKVCSATPAGVKVIAQNIHRIELYAELLYAPVNVNNTFEMKGMLDSGSIAFTFSEEAVERMLTEKVLPERELMTQEVVLVGCGGKLTKPKCIYKVELKIYGESCIVPVLVVIGRRRI